MNNFLNIQESFLDSKEVNTKTIKITNTSEHFINNLKLIIDSSTSLILEPAVVRERGTLYYDTDTFLFDLGNLAPQESALFEYKSDTATLSLLKHISLSFTPEDADAEITETPITNE